MPEPQIPDEIIHIIASFTSDPSYRINLYTRKTLMPHRIAVFMGILKSNEPRHEAQQKRIIRQLLLATSSNTSALQQALKIFFSTDEPLNCYLSRDNVSIELVILTMIARMKYAKGTEISTFKNRYLLILKLLRNKRSNVEKILESIYLFLDDANKEKVISELLAKLADTDYDNRNNATHCLTSIISDTGTKTKSRIANEITNKIAVVNDKTPASHIKAHWEILKAIFPHVDNKADNVKMIFDTLASKRPAMRSYALEALPIIFPYVGEEDKRKIMTYVLENLFEKDGNVNSEICQIISKIFPLNKHNNDHLNTLLDKISDSTIPGVLGEVLMAILPYAETQKSRIVTIILNTFEQSSLIQVRYSELATMYFHVEQEDRARIIDSFLNRFLDKDIKDEDFALYHSKISQAFGDIFLKAANKPKIITAIKNKVENDFKKWPEIIVIYPHIENKISLIDAALEQPCCEALAIMYNDAQDKNKIIDKLLELVASVDRKTRFPAVQALFKILPHADTANRKKIRVLLQTVLTDANNTVYWEELPGLLEMYLYSDVDKKTLVQAALIQLGSDEARIKQQVVKALATMFMELEHQADIIHVILDKLTADESDSAHELIYGLIQDIFSLAPSGDQDKFITALIDKLKADNLMIFSNALQTLEVIFHKINNPLQKQSIINAMEDQIASDPHSANKIIDVYLKMIGQTTITPPELLSLENGLTQNSAEVDNLIAIVFADLKKDTALEETGEVRERVNTLQKCGNN